MAQKVEISCDYCGKVMDDSEDDEWFSVADDGAWDFCSLEHLASWSSERLGQDASVG